MAIDPLVLKLGAALGIGLLIGVERERRKGSGASRSPAGIRTFAVGSLAGAVSVVGPSGKPQTARTWFSNWLTRAPSIVQ